MSDKGGKIILWCMPFFLSPPKLRFEGFCTVKPLTYVVRDFFNKYIYVHNDIIIFHFMGFYY